MKNTLWLVVFLLCFLSHNCQFLDEMQTFDKECLGESKFQCLSGGCTEWESYCDGNIDCDDGSDENFCLRYKPDEVLCNATHQYMCADASHCISRDWVCNNNSDCVDGSDEVNCTELVIAKNSDCKGFKCASDGNCISKVWVCDTKEDCADGSDETIDNCRHAIVPHQIHEGLYCNEFLKLPERSYRCVDSSYCLPQEYMCDGLVDCRDGSDEGEICRDWHSQCSNFSCLAAGSVCSPDRGGPVCLCLPSQSSNTPLRYNYSSHSCDAVDECLTDRPLCSQHCQNRHMHFLCSCDDGYVSDEFQHLCFAQGPEAMLFFSTRNEIKYYKVKTNETVTVATGIKQAHGVAYDGSYVYWVDQAKGHQSISRAHLEDVEGTKEVLIGLGIEDPGDIVIDHVGGNFFFSDTERGSIFVCKKDGSACTSVDVKPKNPRFLTLDAYNGILYWADWKFSPVILTASVSGGGHSVLVDNLATFATGLALDAPNRRLYYVDKRIKAVKLDDKRVYTLLDESHHPYSLAVFEHLVYFSDWTTNSIQTLNKMQGKTVRNELLTLDSHVSGLFMYQPVLQRQVSHNPCGEHRCSHICLVTSNVTSLCACPTGMRLAADGVNCEHLQDPHFQYLIIGSGSTFTRLPYQTLSSLHAEATTMSIGHVKAMTMDYNNTLYMYDTKRRSISYINLDEFSIGLTHLLVYSGLRDVVDLGYDFASHSLYWLDAGFRMIGVMDLKTSERTALYRFGDGETPISFCVVPQYGKLIVAVLETDQNNAVHLDSIGLNGEGREHLIMNNLKGPRVTVRYSHTVNQVYIADEGYGTIDVMHPSGSGRENYIALPSASVSTLSVAEFYVFWTDIRSSRLYWSDIHEAHPKIRQIEMSLFAKSAPLFLTTTISNILDSSPLHSHPCRNRTTCSFICVQSSHVFPTNKEYTHQHSCLCPPGLKNGENQCAERVFCRKDQIYCHHSNVCFEAHELCDGKKDCPHGEDEVLCDKLENIICGFNEMLCWGKCIDKFDTCRKEENVTVTCPETEFKCPNESLCLDRSRVCDSQADCLDSADERACANFSCLPSEFMCDSGLCILNSWRCDGEADCKDGTDEVNCATKTCAVGLFQCGNGDCIDLSSRCDGQEDCADKADEKDCHEVDHESLGQVECAAWEHACENNKSICLPLTSRCNGFANCPGGTDEVGCDPCSQHGLFQCKSRLNCVTRHALCDGVKQCEDGSDETAEACEKVQKKSPISHHFAPGHGVGGDCLEGYRCGTGRCLEWRQVCDHHIDCIDGTDEGKLCSKTCKNVTCSQSCRATPQGPQCACFAGFKLGVAGSCMDVDECSRAACPQACFNTLGSYECACHRGYALRADHHSCKATTGNMTVLYVNFNSVLAISMDGHTGVEFHDATVAAITDIDYDVRRNNLYIAVPSAGKVIESNTSRSSVAVSNVGMPTKVTVDWITGNIYFVDATPKDSWMRVCHIARQRCAKLQPLPDNTRVTALTIDPHSRLLFYCVTAELESTVVASTLGGRLVANVTAALNCTGLAADSFERKLYVAQNTGFLRIGYDGSEGKTIISNDPNFESPTGLALFEDHIYFLVANSYKFNRCLLYASKRCEPFYWRLFEANTFVIKHESVQRDDVRNHCEGFVCSNVCVLKDNGAACVCNDGQLEKDGVCAPVKQSELPLFDGWSTPAARAHSFAFTVLGVVMVMLGLYLAFFVYYHFFYRKKRQALPYMEVRFQNAEIPEDSNTPVVDFSAAGGSGPAQEYVNPLQYVRNAWATLHKAKPVGTAGLDINVPRAPEQDTSDTESDIDAQDSSQIVQSKHQAF